VKVLEIRGWCLATDMEERSTRSVGTRTRYWTWGAKLRPRGQPVGRHPDAGASRGDARFPAQLHWRTSLGTSFKWRTNLVAEHLASTQRSSISSMFMEGRASTQL
jgi:hypothetical protein